MQKVNYVYQKDKSTHTTYSLQITAEIIMLQEVSKKMHKTEPALN